MHWIDWLIMTLPLMICAIIAIYTRRYMRSVADFMAGGRNARRFLICTAVNQQGTGAAVFVGLFQGFLVAGFTMNQWWNQLTVPVGLFFTITGFVIYRYRQTRAMTVGQFLEMRYSRNFRLFAGSLGFLAGLLNFGIIPAVGARFMVTFLNFPQTVQLMQVGSHSIIVPTYLLLMALFLSLCVIMTTTAGQVSVLLTDCAEGMFSQLFFTLIAICLLVFVFKWSTTKTALLASPPGQSLVNPFDTNKTKDFNIWTVLIGIYTGIYRCQGLAWQNKHAFNSSAASAHEARMGGILGGWRNLAAGVMITLLCVCASTYYKTHFTEVNAVLSHIKDPAARDQMTAPTALNMMLPVGVKGMLLSICLMGIIAGDGIHLHSWGSIFIQDVVLPLRKKPLTPKQHIRLLRLAIFGVAVWAFMFGWLFPQIKLVGFWWSITEAVFVGGAGITILAGLYSSRGTTAAAWTSLIVGATGALIFIGIQVYYTHVLRTDDIIVNILHHPIRVNIPGFTLINTLVATTCYMVVSKLTYVQPHNMDKLLHRGEYAVEPESDVEAEEIAKRQRSAATVEPLRPRKKVNWVFRILTMGIDEQFTRTDRWITIGITSWNMFWFALFVLGSLAYLVHHWSNSAWADYFLITQIYLPIGIGTVTTIWFIWGCTHDMRIFFSRLKEERVDAHDDGTVIHAPDDNLNEAADAEPIVDLPEITAK